MDMENWMGNLPSKLKHIPLIHLAIPGSHDSMTSTITYHSKIAPDAENIIQQIKFLGPIVRLIMSRWSKTQSYNITQQLTAGIRYFDFRVATKNGSVYPFFVHGLYATEVTNTLNDLSNFLNTHPNEVVIIDFQHFYAFQKQDHENFLRFLKTTFDKKLTPYTHSLESLSLSHLRKNKHQVFIIYRSDQVGYNQPLLWPGYYFPTPWPQTLSLSELMVKLNQGLINRPCNHGYISQFVLTPTTWFVSKHLFSTLKQKCVMPTLKAKFEWLQKQKNGPDGVNIVICDFIDLHNCDFAKEVVSINIKSASYEALTPVDNAK